jgi:hypothetical protein
MLRGLASLLDDCPTVLSGDYGEALFADAQRPGGYDVALHLDFADADGYAAYVAHPTHVAVAAFNASLSVEEPEGSTVRVDWLYDGPARVHPGAVRRCEAFVWADGVDPGDRERALEAVSLLYAEPGVLSALAAEDAGGDPRAADWILDVELSDESAARGFLEGDGYTTARAAIEAAVDPGRTARITHAERGR